MLCFDEPAGRSLSIAAARSDFCTQFRAFAEPGTQIDGTHVGSRSVTLVRHGSRTDAHGAAWRSPIGPKACVELAIGEPVDLVIDHHELRIEVEVTAENGFLERDRSGQSIDVVIDEADQFFRRNNQFGTKPVTHFEHNLFAVGDQAAAREAVGAGNALSLDLVPAEAGGDFCRETLRTELTQPRFRLHTGCGAVVPGKTGLVEAGFEIAVKRIERRRFHSQIKLLTRCRVEAAGRCIAEHRVISVRIKRTEHTLVFGLFRAVIGEGDEIFPEHAALGIERHACFVPKIAVEPPGALHILGDGPCAHRPFGETDYRPFDVAGHDPCLEFLFTYDFAIVEPEVEPDRAAHHGRGQFDQRNPVSAADDPAGRARFEAGQLIELLAFDLFGALIGGAERKLAGHAFAQRPVVAIEHAHGNHGPCTTVSHKVRQLGYQFDFRGSGGEEDLALDRLVDFAEAVYDVCAQHRAFVLQRNAAPLAHSVFAGLCLAGAFEVEAAYRLAVDTKRDFLSLAVPDCDANSRGTWIVTDFGGQPAIGAIAQGDPVGRRAVCFRHGVAFALRARFVPACLDDLLDCRREGVFRQARMEICDDKRSALSNREARR